MATSTRIIINIILIMFLVIILCIIGAMVYVWVTCPSLGRCTWNLIWGKPLNERPMSDKAFFASIDGSGRGKYTGLSQASVFGAGLNTEEMESFGETNVEKEAPSKASGNADFYGEERKETVDSNGPASVAASPSKKGRGFDRMGPTFDDW